jgi:hypothetical protein
MATATTPSDARRADEMRSVLANAGGSMLGLVAVATGLAAGVLHLIVAPMHFGEHVGQGIFMVVLGVLQIAWGLAFFRGPSVRSYVVGVVLTLGSIVVWAVSVTIRPPFQDAAEPVDMIAYSTKAVEAIALLCLFVLPLVGSRSERRSAGRALPLLLVALLLGVVMGGGAYGAGLVGEKVAPALGEPDSAAMGGDHAADAGPGAATSSGMDMTAASTHATNGTTNGTSTPSANANETYDYSNCMVGMDMPGCPAAVAARMAAGQGGSTAPPPPDKVLAPVKIDLTPDGSKQDGKFTLETGTKQLLVTLRLNDSGPGPYAALGMGGQGDLKVTLKPASGSGKTITITGSAQSVGVDPAAPLSRVTSDVLGAPAEGGWTLTVEGMGQNAYVSVELTERFY